jgi:propanol-preferring alcohol dehydrogenase
MQAQVLHEWGGEVTLQTRPVPAPGPGEALVQVEACSVGLTVLNYMNGNHSRRPQDLPRIPGHEAVGRVTAVASGVTRPRVGERVITHFYLFCGACDQCHAGREPLCRNLAGQVGVARDGGYAEHLVLPAHNLIPIPDRIAPIAATAIPDAIATPLHVSRRAGIAPGDVVVVVGAGGGVGIHMVQMARTFGATVIAVERSEAKGKAASEAGALAALDFDTPDLADAVRALAPGGVTVAVDLVGNAATLAFCVAVLGRRGRLVVLTTFPGVAAELSPRRLVQDEISILGSRYASRGELGEAARFVAEGRITPVVSEVVPLARVRELHAKLRAGTLIGRGAVVMGPEHA